MTNPYITKLNELIADINENEIASHDNPKSLKGWCERWREEATMCSIALYEAKIEQNPSGDAISRKIISAFLSGLISDETERKKALQYINELPSVNPMPCGDAISRQAVIDSLHSKFADGFDSDRWWNSMSVLYAINKVPPVNPTKTGHWTHDGSHWENRFICSECEYKLFEEQTNYCPNCGARMESEEV